MNTYELRTADDAGMCGIVTDSPVKAVAIRSTGYVHLGEADSLGRFKARGLRASVGLDPTAPAPVLVVLDEEGREVHRAAVEEVGEPDPGWLEGVE